MARHAAACLGVTLLLLGPYPAGSSARPDGLRLQAEAASLERHFSLTLTSADYERLFEQPFDVPAGVRRVEVGYRVSGADARTVVDLGLRSPSGARLRSAGHRLTAVGGSDGHTVADDADRRLGRPATVVWGSALSEAAVVAGLKGGRVYVRVRGPDGPRLEFHAEHAGGRVAMGGSLPAGGQVRLIASVSGAEGQTLQWIVDGEVAAEAVVASSPLTLEQPAVAGRWFSLVVRDARGPTLLANAIAVTGTR